MTESVQKKLNDSAALRWTALVLLAGAMFFAYIFMDILSPLQMYSYSSLFLRESFSTKWECALQPFFLVLLCLLAVPLTIMPYPKAL